jgi:hypothetical protein
MAEGKAIEAEVKASTLASGWSVRCIDDRYTAAKTCIAGTFSIDQRPFRILFVNGKGPTVSAGFNTYPGRTASIRVDNGPVRSAADAAAVIKDLSTGRRAYIIYHTWPEGPNRMELDLSGFNEAYAKLRSII